MISKNLVPSLVILSLLNACASSQNYKTPPSSKNLGNVYNHEQLTSPATKQVSGAVLSGIIGGLLGPIGILVTAIGSSASQKQGIVSYLKQMDGAEMAGIVIEDVTEKRNREFLSNQRWFSNLPAEADLPRHLNIDLGSGNSFVFPIEKSVEANVGDVVTVIATHSTHNLASARADFFKDLPRVTAVRCKYDNRACVDLPENGLGVIRRLE